MHDAHTSFMLSYAMHYILCATFLTFYGLLSFLERYTKSTKYENERINSLQTDTYKHG